MPPGRQPTLHSIMNFLKQAHSASLQELAVRRSNHTVIQIQSPIRPSCTGPDPAIGLPMASLTYWTKLIDSSNRRVFFLRGPETQHGVLTSLGEYKNDKNKNIPIIIWE